MAPTQFAEQVIVDPLTGSTTTWSSPYSSGQVAVDPLTGSTTTWSGPYSSGQVTVNSGDGTSVSYGSGTVTTDSGQGTTVDWGGGQVTVIPGQQTLVDYGFGVVAVNPDFSVSQGDKFQLDFDNNPVTIELPRGAFNAGRERGRTLVKAAKAAYRDKNQRQRGDQALHANEAVFFRFGSRTYLSVNDNRGGFSASRDLVVDVTGMEFKLGDARAGVLTVRDYFG